jgi:hypothetical protein
MTIWRMRIACWIPKATNTHSQYVILTAFPLQQWLQEHVSMLRYTCIACSVMLSLPRHYILSRLKNTVERRTFRPMVTQWSGYDVERIGAL